ncbi:hypothetical protein HD553DRAFT_73968 [Filobasidium floriforme]|uniref:uncharacterized protein n=1 Tax=Filobasidium floriforme TaxID=5210 RepID=UPI001E8D3E7D|nr:uncharacterized protein HD553DRAFT_73968 [Filobasidium floriforme]KAH8081792.1 hypothetical protein HD553DRAFT_73968 [Filobasidium floriforme]
MVQTLLMTGGDWWSRPTKNLGQQFIIQLIQNSRSSEPSPNKLRGPINVYVCTRRPPPAKELDLSVLRQSSSTSGWFSTIAPQDNGSTSDDNILDRIKLHHLPLDLTSPSSIRACAKSFLEKESKLDVLLLNAAVAPKSRNVTNVKLKGEPVEEALMTNVLGHALLTESLKSAFHERGSERSTRIVTVSSELHRRIQEIVSPDTISDLLGPAAWDGMRAYKITKLIQTHAAFALREMFPDSQLESIAVSPGEFLTTDIARGRSRGGTDSLLSIETGTTGFVPSTNLSQNSPWLARLFMQYLLHYAPFASTPEEGGKKIYEACFGETASPAEDAVYLKDHQSVKAADAIYDVELRRAWAHWIRQAIDGLVEPPPAA